MAPPYSYARSNKVSTFKIYLSNLPDGLKNSDIKTWFEEYGRTVECEVFKKNYGFVHMEEEECGRKAVQGLNKKEVNGKFISVSISKNMEPPNIASTKLQVKHLPHGAQPASLRGLFQKFGLVLEAEITKNGEGVVSLEATGDIRTAINEMNGFELDGRKLLVEPVKVNLKAERYGSAPSQMEWQPKPSHNAYPSSYRMDSRPQASGGRYSLGGGYGPSAQVEEFYGRQSEEYYEEDEYYEPYEYEAAAQPARRFPMTHTAGARPPHPGLRAGVDYVRRDAMYYEDDASFLPNRQALAPPQQRVARAPSQPLQGYGEEEYDDTYESTPQYTPQSHYFSGRGGGRGFGRGGMNSTNPYLPPRKKVARGEPYPAPPVPNPRALLGQGFRGGFRGGMRAPGATMSAGIRPKTRGRGQGPSLLAAARAAAAGRASSQFGNVRAQGEPDPFAPSAAEKRLIRHIGGNADPSIDFTADIMLA